MQCPRCRRTIDAQSHRCAWCGINVPPGQHLLEDSGVVVPIRTYVVEGSASELARSLAVLAWLALLGGGAWALPQVCNHPKPLHAPRHLGRVVVEMGRADNFLYFRLPNKGINLSLVNGTPTDAARHASDEDPGKTSKLEAADTTGLVR